MKVARVLHIQKDDSALASSVRTVGKTTQQQRNVVLLSRFIYNKDNLKHKKKKKTAERLLVLNKILTTINQ